MDFWEKVPLMIPLDDPQWAQLKGGYRRPYDPSSALRRLQEGDDVWDELWDNLHHQGDVGDASYATVPHLVAIMKRSSRRDFNFYNLVSTIEIERHQRKNPALSGSLEESYVAAWADLLELATADLKSAQDPFLIQSLIGTIALAKGQTKLGALISYADEWQIDDILEHYYTWSQAYQ
jgi:hypothetical protein